jgi:SAM-dependent methyltransferase
MRLEIGGGTLTKPGWENIDPVHGSRPEFKVYVQDGIALPDNSVVEVFASHVMEHIPQGEPRIKTMNEVNRVLRPGGTFTIIVPCVGYTDHENGGGPVHAGWQAYGDPTHVSFWWFPESFWYLTGKFAANASYGMAPWEEKSMILKDGWEAHVVLAKPQR